MDDFNDEITDAATYGAEIFRLQNLIEEQSKEITAKQEQIADMQNDIDKAERRRVRIKELSHLVKKQKDTIKEYSDLVEKQNDTIKEYSDLLAKEKDLSAKRKKGAEDARIVRKTAEVYKKQLTAANAELAVFRASDLGAAQAEIENLRKEADKKQAEYKAAEADLLKVADIADLENYIFKNIIVEEIKKQYPDMKDVDLTKEKLHNLIEKSKSLDTKYASDTKTYNRKTGKGKSATKPVLTSQAYSQIVNECTEQYRDLENKLNTSSNKKGQETVSTFKERYKGKTDEQIIEQIIDDNSKIDYKASLKSKKATKFIVGGVAVAVVVVGVALAFAGLFGKTNKNLQQSQNTNQNLTSYSQAYSEYGNYDVDGLYKAVVSPNNEAVEALKTYNDEALAKSSAEYRSAGDIYREAKIAYENATGLVNGQEHKDNVAGFSTAVEAQNAEDVTTYGQKLQAEYQEMNGYADVMTKSVKDLATIAGVDLEHLSEQLALLQQPTKSFTVNDSTFQQYKSVLQKGSFEATGIETCTYEKATGKVEMIIKGLDKYDNVQYGFVTYNIDAGLTNPTLSQVMAPVLNGGEYKYTIYDNTVEQFSGNEVVTMSVGENTVAGDASVQYQFGYQYNPNADTTHVKAEVTTFVRDANGKINPDSMSVFTIEFNVGGKQTKAELQKLVEQQIVNQLYNMIEQEI